MIRITAGISIDEDEVHMDYVRASGPGGQNVNKVATAAKLRFDVANSPSLSEEVRACLMELAGRRLNAQGVIVIDARRYRTQERNRQDAAHGADRFEGVAATFRRRTDVEQHELVGALARIGG